MVARERFELSSAGPEPAMLDRYTTGLQPEKGDFLVISLALKIAEREERTRCFLLLHSVSYATASHFNL